MNTTSVLRTGRAHELVPSSPIPPGVETPRWLARLLAIIGSALILLPLALQKSARAAEPSLPEEWSYAVGLQAVVYGLAPVIMDVNRSDLAPPAWRNRFRHAGKLASPATRGGVSPNVDTVYSSAWLDLAQGPQVLQLPNLPDRYHSLQFIDAYSNSFAYLGTRASGGKGGAWAVVGPGWKGQLPPDLHKIEAPTNSVWLLLRILVSGSEDLPNVTPLLPQFTLRPFDASEISLPGETPHLRTPLVPRILAMGLPEFFGTLLRVIRENPPPPHDAALLSQLESIGVSLTQEFALDHLDPAVQRGLQRALEGGKKLVQETPRAGEKRGAWTFASHTPAGMDFRKRAVQALGGLAALGGEESIYGRSNSDDSGRPLTGEKRYVVRFAPGQLPPVQAFWSLTLYGPDRFLVENPLKRYALGDRSPGLALGQDGSLEILVQHESPSGREGNWLPAPAGPFQLTLRLYLPKPEAVAGRWPTPAIVMASP